MSRLGARRRWLRRALACAAAAVVAAVAVAAFDGPVHVAAQSVISKYCADPGSSGGVAQPGDTIGCLISADDLTISTGSAITITPTSPSGATIPAGGCTGVTESTYTTTASGSGASCTFTVTSGSVSAGMGNNLGNEQLTIPAATPANTSVTQTATECPGVAGMPNPACTALTNVNLPVATTGPGSCVDGTPASSTPGGLVGGCSPLATPTPSATPTGQVAGTSSTSPFTSGPQHPFPVGGSALAAAGIALALAGGLGPALLRRRLARSGRGD